MEKINEFHTMSVYDYQLDRVVDRVIDRLENDNSLIDKIIRRCFEIKQELYPNG